MTLYDAQRLAIKTAIQAAAPLCEKVYDYWTHPLNTDVAKLYDFYGRKDEKGLLIDTWFFGRRTQPEAVNEKQIYGENRTKQILTMTETWEVEGWTTLVDPLNSPQKRLVPSEHEFSNIVDEIRLQLYGHEEMRKLLLLPFRCAVMNVSTNDQSAMWLADTLHCLTANMTITFQYIIKA